MTGLEWVGLVVLAWVGYCLDFDLDNLKDAPTLGWWVQLTKTWAAKTVIVTALSVGLCRLVKWFVREPSKEQKILARSVNAALDTFRSVVYPKLPEQTPIDHNRVTVFVHNKSKWWIWPWKGYFTPWGLGRWPWSGWLEVVYRSGHVTQLATTVYLAPDDAAQAEGVAGQAWRCGSFCVGLGDKKLPDLSQAKYVDPLNRFVYDIFLASTVPKSPEIEAYGSTRKQVADYAKATCISTALLWRRIKRKKHCPLSMVGVHLKNRRGDLWGVVVMDSCNSVACLDPKDKSFRAALRELIATIHDLGITDE